MDTTNAAADGFEQLAGETWDLLVIGGGIVGSGVARDAAIRGLRVALVDRHDFAFGTSSRSSRLLHGGLRYPAQGGSAGARGERGEMHPAPHAPHLAALAVPLPHLPADALDAVETVDRGPRLRPPLQPRIWARADPGGRPDGGKAPRDQRHNPTGGVRYFDGLTSDARLVIDTLRSAVRHGAAVRNFTALEVAETAPAGWSCRLRDGSSGREVRATVARSSTPPAAGPTAAPEPRPAAADQGNPPRARPGQVPGERAVVMAEGSILFAIP